MTTQPPRRSERRRPRWLLRPSETERFFAVVAGAGFVGSWLIAGGSAFSWLVLGLFVLLFAAAGVMFSVPRRRGVAVRGDVLELQTIVSCTQVPLDQVVRLHLAPHMSAVGVETEQSIIRLADGSRVPDQEIEGMRSVAREVGAELGVAVVEYEEVGAFIDATKGCERAGWDWAGFVSVLAWPEVWLTVVVGIGASIIRWM